MNIVVIQGSLSRAPESRELPSGDRLAVLEVTVRDPERPAESVPVVWFEAPARVLKLPAGAEVVVTGRIRRRFFQTGSGTGSRTEVVADAVLPATQRKRVSAVIDAASSQLELAAAS